MNNIFKYFWIYVLGSFLGCVLEVIWCFIKYKKIESRKVLIYGYYIPIYGIATILISLIVESFNIKNMWHIILVTFIICFIVEYLSSLFQEKCFGTKSWDYSKMLLNINGRVNIPYLLAWSIIGILWCKLYPILLKIIFKVLIKFKIFNLVTYTYIIYLFLNTIISIIASFRQKERRIGKKPRNIFEVWIDKKYNDEYLKKVYANATFVKLPKIKERFN